MPKNMSVKEARLIEKYLRRGMSDREARRRARAEVNQPPKKRRGLFGGSLGGGRSGRGKKAGTKPAAKKTKKSSYSRKKK